MVLSIILIVVFIFMWIMSPAQFVKVGNLQSMAFQLPELGVLSLGMMVTLLTGGVNLAIIATSNLTGIVTVTLLNKIQGDAESDAASPLKVLFSIIAGFAASLGVGCVIGLLVSNVGVSPILASMGLMTFIDGVNIVLTKGYTIAGVPKSFIFLGNELLLGIPIPIIVFALCAALIAIVLNKTALGYSIYMVGSNEIATMFSGINNKSVLIRVYMISSFLASIANVIMMGRFNSIKADYGSSYLLVTILASVLGGTSAYGGFGKVSGLILALIILQIIASGLNLMLVDPFLTTAMWGAIMILAMVTNYISAYYRRKKQILQRQES
jgi:simple sugar transport system permease protein